MHFHAAFFTLQPRFEGYPNYFARLTDVPTRVLRPKITTVKIHCKFSTTKTSCKYLFGFFYPPHVMINL